MLHWHKCNVGNVRTEAQVHVLLAGDQTWGRQMPQCSQKKQWKSQNNLVAMAMRSLWWLMVMVTWMWSS